MSLTIRSTEKIPGVFILYPVGRLDSNSYSVLEKKIDYLLGVGQARHLTLDMTGVDYISSMGVRVVLKAHKDLKQKGGLLSMMNLQPQIEKVFEIIKALPSMRIYNSIQELDDYLTEMQKQTLTKPSCPA
ncbi:MAG: anti-sigma factor antagonist [Desulfobacca sp.]|nr:anti-sigma factor antagonist [Desulfobacca sp.]